MFDQFPCDRYFDLIHEEARNWSYMKFPYLADQRQQANNADSGWYKVGPLARVNNCDFFDTPLAESCRQDFMLIAGTPLCHLSLAYHWARMIEALHCAEAIRRVLRDPDLMSRDLITHGERQPSGIGVIEAPRGTLFHHYEVDDEDRVTMANLIVSTTSNNWAMNQAICDVANQHLDGNTIDEGLLNLLEVAVRAYDPCLSCATHAVGQMPLIVELQHLNGKRLHAVSKDSRGNIHALA
ncbi:NAD-reducing hydrogenase HoxS subunit beta [BD1-7 clade bacterium]|uniref:NAD-reducing hydrogenase HoxS subunit beta n=1 Tax=BD1-7 clade bacterium TaxID=2029982 RepID=A0A5S9QNZ7_9GAMM|nr:NAD-reducing hydrogenase HoxS subunit beta [BD1-7 clade bacterium]CAA0121051.1 NAD-reducing hydrogenase HoxS subunit beta [BD1-7 clade bacterium]